VPERLVISMASFSASEHQSPKPQARCRRMALKPLRLALLESEGPLMTLLTVTVGGAGTDTVDGAVRHRNVSPCRRT